MKKALKKAFTLVELLVVIAIIAVLSVAGIVGYSVFTKKAETSNDIAAVTQFDTLLQGYEALEGKPSTFSEAVDRLKEEGIDLDNFKLASENHKLGFDAEKGKILLVEDGKIISPEEYAGQSISGNSMFLVEQSTLSVDESDPSDLQADLQSVLSDDSHAHYIPEKVAKKLGKNSILTVSSSLDAKNYAGSLTYSDTSDTEETVTINCGYNPGNTTYPFGTPADQDAASLKSVTIDNPNATVYQSGVVGDIVINDVNEYHCNARIWTSSTEGLKIKGSGTIIMEEGCARNEYWKMDEYRGATGYIPTQKYLIAKNDECSEVRNITIEIKDYINNSYYGKAGCRIVINIELGCKNVNLTIKNKGGELYLSGGLGAGVSGADRKLDSESYYGYIDNDGVFHKDYTNETWVAAASMNSIRRAPFSTISTMQEEDYVATSDYMRGHTGSGTYYYTAADFAAADDQRTNPLWGGNCNPTSDDVTNVKLLKNATLERNITMGYLNMPEVMNVIFDLQGHTLTFAEGTLATYLVYAESGKSIQLTVQNGTIVDDNVNNSFVVYTLCNITLSNVTYISGNTAVYVAGDSTVSTIENSYIDTSSYCIATNASLSGTNLTINITNSNLTSQGTAVLMNVPNGKLNITGGTVEAIGQAVFVRAGTATITGATLILNPDTTQDPLPLDFFDYRLWDQGNRANYGALVLGNKNAGSDYQHSVSAVVTNCKFIVKASGFPAIYVWSNNSAGNGVTLTYSDCTFTNGHVILGGNIPTMQFDGSALTAAQEEYFADNYGLFNLTVNGVSYAGQQGPITLE